MQVLNTNWNLLAEDTWWHLLAPECLRVKNIFRPFYIETWLSHFQYFQEKCGTVKQLRY